MTGPGPRSMAPPSVLRLPLGGLQPDHGQRDRFGAVRRGVPVKPRTLLGRGRGLYVERKCSAPLSHLIFQRLVQSLLEVGLARTKGVNAAVSRGVGRYNGFDAVQEFRVFFILFPVVAPQILAGGRPRARDKVANGLVRRCPPRCARDTAHHGDPRRARRHFCPIRVLFEHFVHEQGFGAVTTPSCQGHFDRRCGAASGGTRGRRWPREPCPVDLGGRRQVRTVVVCGRGAQFFDARKDRLVV